MARTQVTGSQILDHSVQRADLDTTTVGQAVITKVVAGNGINLEFTGVDTGTGDVTVKVNMKDYQQRIETLLWMGGM
jgi:hypothetical protein